MEWNQAMVFVDFEMKRPLILWIGRYSGRFCSTTASLINHNDPGPLYDIFQEREGWWYERALNFGMRTGVRKECMFSIFCFLVALDFMGNPSSHW